MKQLALSLCVLLAAMVPSGVSADVVGLDVLSIDDTDSVVTALLTAKPVRAPQVVRPDQLQYARGQVWNEWRDELLSALPESLLPPLSHPLGPDTAAVWHIPAALEPDADLLLHYGVKPDSTGAVPRGLPMFIYLHGSGPRDMEWQTGLLLAQRFDDAPSVYMIPRIANEGAWYRWYQRGKQQAIESWIRIALARGIDPDRIYIFGISEGGYGSQRLASFYADYLAGAGPMAGGEPLRNAPPENLRNTAFSLLTGEKDAGFYRNRLTMTTSMALDNLQAEDSAGYEHRVELVPGMGHGFDYRPTTPWLAAHRRPYMPRRVSWENFDMDGRKRNAFHNLAVVEPNDTAADGSMQRTRYDLTVDSVTNTVNLDVRRVHYTVTETDPNWGIQLTFDKNYTPATSGLVRVYLSPEMVDLSRPVTVVLNGRKIGSVRPRMTYQTLRESCRLFGDPRRLFPAEITVNLARRSVR